MMPVAAMDPTTPMGGADGMWAMTGPMWMPTQPPSLARVLGVHLQPVPLVPLLGLLALAGYAVGVLALRRRGQRWPARRGLAWLAGIAILELATTTGVEGYGMMVFSIHMAQHMALAMVVPILLALAAPHRLIIAAVPTERVALRQALARLPATPAVRALTSTPVRWSLFLASLYGVYFTPLFGALMHTVWGHNLMLLHFLLTGWLFFGPLVASSPASAPRRLTETFAGAPLHAVFGLAVLLATRPMVPFFDDPDPRWGVTALGDQTLAGSIAWVSSEVATVLVAVIILGQSLAALRRGGTSPAVDQTRSRLG